MSTHSRRAAWVQGALLVAAIAAIVVALALGVQRPFDRDTLAIQVAQLQSDAAEAQVLVDNARADRLAPGFVRQHAQQMAAKVDTTNGTLEKSARPELASYKAQAQQLGASLHAGLALLGRDGSARIGFDTTADALDALRKRLKPAD
ncbi:MAG: hypothetical protein ACJ8GK_07440 [Luteimonas sp.]